MVSLKLLVLHGTLIDHVAKLLPLFASKLINYIYVFAEGAEKGPYKFHSNGECLAHAKEGNGKGCYFAETCSSGGDCR
ncbi:hypothetical protein ES319_D03G103300v1 [Gossypium barbadense]|uniref:Uncharacterized protein n=1 Tax=Gossypium barbadense TaxID=3634 RepID=A0A5J5S2P1_GOSBA|nr:hypothetical protein ES319_D03G103300v1 [Gossypium barbadense]